MCCSKKSIPMRPLQVEIVDSGSQYHASSSGYTYEVQTSSSSSSFFWYSSHTLPPPLESLPSPLFPFRTYNSRFSISRPSTPSSSPFSTRSGSQVSARNPPHYGQTHERDETLCPLNSASLFVSIYSPIFISGAGFVKSRLQLKNSSSAWRISRL